MDKKRLEDEPQTAVEATKTTASNPTSEAGDDAENLYQQASGLAQRAYSEAKDAISNVTNEAPARLNQALDTGQQYLDASNRAVGRQIAGQPIAALVAAVFVGYALAWLIHGRERAPQRYIDRWRGW